MPAFSARSNCSSIVNRRYRHNVLLCLLHQIDKPCLKIYIIQKEDLFLTKGKSRMLCKFCGREVPDHSVFCLTCGKEIDRTDLSEVGITHESTQPMTPNTNNESPLSEPSTTLEKKSWVEKLRKNPKVLVGIGVAVLAACFFASCVKGLGDDNNKIPAIIPTEATDTVESGTTTQETEEPINWYELDWSKQTSELQALNNVSAEDFRKDTQDDQLMYCGFLSDIYYTPHSKYGTDGGIYSEHKSASLDDPAQEIANQQKNKMTMIDSTVNEDGNFDKDEARKLLSFLVYDINDTINSKDDIVTNGENLDKFINEVPEGAAYSHVVNASDLDQTGSNRSEVKYYSDGTPYITLTITENGQTTYNAYVFATYPNNLGKPESTWLLKQVSITPIN